MAARPFGGYVKRKVDEIDRRYARVLATGFPTAPFNGQPEPETLQCRTVQDQVHWLGLIAKCQAAIAQGYGDMPISPPLRCTSNREYTVSHSEALTRMFLLMSDYAAALSNWWRLKDEARGCEKRTDLDLIDLEAGWP